jgi:short-subunit dehydrogenase
MREVYYSIIHRIKYNIGKFLAFIGKRVDRYHEKRLPVSPRSVLITGASSGIGAELARQYAAEGVFLYLTARNELRLGQVAADCQAKGAKVEMQLMDICDDVAVEKWIKSLPRLDLVIANAGVSGGGMEDNNITREIFSVNIGGVINVILPMVEKARQQQMVENSRGHIAVVASMAALSALPSAPAYSASKSCAAAYADALRGALKKEKIQVSTIGPGYIRTPLTDQNNFPMPMLMEVGEAAAIIRKGLWKKKGRIYFPKRMYYGIRLVNMLPHFLTDPILRRLPQKA